MPLTTAQIDRIMDKLHDDFTVAWRAKDVKKLAALYHPNATLVAANMWVARGPQEIEEKFAEMLKGGSEVKYNFELKDATDSGEYLVQRGTFEPLNGSGIVGKFESILRKQDDGSYLVYHDEFSF